MWTFDDVALDNTVLAEEVCEEFNTDGVCLGSRANPLFLEVPTYDPTVDNGLADENHTLSVTVTDPAPFGSEYMSVTKDLHITYGRNNYWTYNVAYEESGPLTLTYNPEGDESYDITIDVNNVYGEDVDCTTPSDCMFINSICSLLSDPGDPPATIPRPLPLCVVSPFGSVKKF